MLKLAIAVLVSFSGLPALAADASYDAELNGFVYPFEAKFFEVTSQKQKLRMAYMDVSPEKPSGKVAVLLHGKNFAGYYWEPTIKSLVSEGYRVIVPDQIGFGKSAKPQNYQFSFHGLASNTRALLDDLKISGKIVVVGHSMGGMLASRFALMYPDRVSRLVLVNPIGLEDIKRFVPYTSIDQGYEQELKSNIDSIRSYQKAAYYDGQWKPEYETLIQAAAGQTRHADFSKVAWNAALTSEMVYTQPVVHEFKDIKVPTLLIIGQRDRTAPGRQLAPPEIAKTLGDYPKLGRAAKAAIKGSKLVEMKGIGHVPQIEDYPSYWKALSDFIK